MFVVGPLCILWALPWKLRWPPLSSCPTCLILFQSLAFCSSIYNILFSGFFMSRWLCLQLLCVCNLLFMLYFLLHCCLACFILLQFMTSDSSIYDIMFSNFLVIKWLCQQLQVCFLLFFPWLLLLNLQGSMLLVMNRLGLHLFCAYNLLYGHCPLLHCSLSRLIFFPIYNIFDL
jgi:hypothetical protein